MALETRGPQIAAVAWSLAVVSTITTLLRIYCRAWVIKSFAADDWLAAAAQVLFLVYCSYVINGVKYGNGQHLANISEGNIPKAMQMWWTCEPTYVLSCMLIKASIAIFLLRICVHKIHKIIIYVVTAVTEIYSAFFFVLFILQCRPTSYFWSRYSQDPPKGHCINASIVPNSFTGYSAISCWADWTYSILPIFLVWNLQMSTRVKISVICILAAGVIASSATIVRFPYLHTMTDVDDFLYSTADVAIWSTVEIGIGITTSALATLRPLLRTFLGGGSSADQYGSSARQWGQSGSNHPSRGYIRSKGTNNVDNFELENNTAKTIGVTTVINYENNSSAVDIERQKYKTGDNGSELSDSIRGADEWNNSQLNLAEPKPPQTSHGWNITVKKSVFQTTEEVRM